MSKDIRKTINKINKINESYTLYHGSEFENLKWNDRNDSPDFNMMGFGYYLTNKKMEAEYYATDNTNNSGYLYTIELINANVLDYNDPISENIKQLILKDNNFYNLFEENFDINNDVDEKLSISWDYLTEDKPSWAKNMKVGYFILNYKTNKILVDGLNSEGVEKYVKNLHQNNDKESIEISEHIYTLLYAPTTGTVNYLTKSMIFNSMYHLQAYLYLKFKSLKEVSNYLVKNKIDGVKNKIDTTDHEFGSIVTVVFNQNKINIISKNRI